MIIYDKDAKTVRDTETGNEVRFLAMPSDREDYYRYLFAGPTETFHLGVRYDHCNLEVWKEFPVPEGLTQKEKFEFNAQRSAIVRERAKRRATIELGYRPGIGVHETRKHPLPAEVTANLLALVLTMTKHTFNQGIKAYAVSFLEIGHGHTPGSQSFLLEHQIDFDGTFSTVVIRAAKP